VGFCFIVQLAAVGTAATVKTNGTIILSFPCTSSSARRRILRNELLSALRLSESPVILDLSGCHTLNHQDIDLLLECVAQVAGRDTEVRFVAGSSENRVLLEVTRISSLVPVFSSLPEALVCPQIAGKLDAESLRAKII
jgi:hypothetical protein